jgi:NAD-dependent dihydropyrimidine dehydrogenase PreA subunit
MAYTVVLENCTADENCAAVCPVDCITFPAEVEGKAVIDEAECIDCAACIDECQFDAILAG